MIHVVESVLYCRHLNVVIPFAFLRNVITENSTKNKACVQLTGVDTQQFIINACRPVPTAEIPCSDLHFTIDNNK